MAQAQQKKIHVRTSKGPLFTDRMKRMHDALHGGTISDLAREMYDMAQEDLDNSKDQVGTDWEIRKRVRKSSEMLVEDRQTNRYLLTLLHTIHRDVISAIILGYLGWRHTTSKDFQKMFLSPTDNCAGTYIITFLVDGKNRTRGLTGNEIRKLQSLIRRYAQGNQKAVTAEEYEEAADIDFQVLQKDHTRPQVVRLCKEGERKFYFDQIELFCNKLEDRIPTDLDPKGEVRQIQGFHQVGCSRDLMSRMAQHDPLTLSRTTCKPFSLVLSCLAVMGIKTKIVRIPIVKVFQGTGVEQLEISEIGITMLAGGYIMDHGMNSYQAGTQGLSNQFGLEHKTGAALDELTFSSPWVAINLAESQAAAEQRIKEFDKVKKVSQKAKEVSARIKACENELDSWSGASHWVEGGKENLGAKTASLQTLQTKVNDEFERTKAELERLKAYSKLQDEVIRWRERSKPKEVPSVEKVESAIKTEPKTEPKPETGDLEHSLKIE